jgi:ABC-2 type transport system permease protein
MSVTADLTNVAAVREAGGTLREDARAVAVIWEREMMRFLRDRVRIATSLAQPVLFLFVLGTGLSPLVSTGAGRGFDFRTFMFPGVIAMTVLFTAVMSGMSLVWDREFGFMREILVAPVRRGAIVLGKCLGGATVAGIQGSLMLALAGFVHVPYSPSLLATMVLEILLMATAMSALGIVIASRIQQMQSFGVVVQFIVMPMFFLSGAVFPLSRLPGWLTALTIINPVSYAVDPMRRAVFAHMRVAPALAETLNPGISWGGWRLPIGLELGMIATVGAVFLAIAILQFSRSD